MSSPPHTPATAVHGLSTASSPVGSPNLDVASALFGYSGVDGAGSVVTEESFDFGRSSGVGGSPSAGHHADDVFDVHSRSGDAASGGSDDGGSDRGGDGGGRGDGDGDGDGSRGVAHGRVTSNMSGLSDNMDRFFATDGAGGEEDGSSDGGGRGGDGGGASTASIEDLRHGLMDGDLEAMLSDIQDHDDSVAAAAAAAVAGDGDGGGDGSRVADGPVDDSDGNASDNDDDDHSSGGSDDDTFAFYPQHAVAPPPARGPRQPLGVPKPSPLLSTADLAASSNSGRHTKPAAAAATGGGGGASRPGGESNWLAYMSPALPPPTVPARTRGRRHDTAGAGPGAGTAARVEVDRSSAASPTRAVARGGGTDSDGRPSVTPIVVRTRPKAHRSLDAAFSTAGGGGSSGGGRGTAAVTPSRARTPQPAAAQPPTPTPASDSPSRPSSTKSQAQAQGQAQTTLPRHWETRDATAVAEALQLVASSHTRSSSGGNAGVGPGTSAAAAAAVGGIGGSTSTISARAVSNDVITNMGELVATLAERVKVQRRRAEDAEGERDELAERVRAAEAKVAPLRRQLADLNDQARQDIAARDNTIAEQASRIKVRAGWCGVFVLRCVLLCGS